MAFQQFKVKVNNVDKFVWAASRAEVELRYPRCAIEGPLPAGVKGAAAAVVPAPARAGPLPTLVGIEANRRKLVMPMLRMPPELICKLSVLISADHSAQRYEEKYTALRSAIELVSRRALEALKTLEGQNFPVFFGAEVKCEACWEPEGPGGNVCLFLGDRMMFQVNRVELGQSRLSGYGVGGPRGVADQVYDDHRKWKLNPARWALAIRNRYQASKVSAKATAVVVHELGHILHERLSPAKFWENKKVGAPGVRVDLATQVSSYLYNNNYDEFVAEVFTGLIHGKTYSEDVMREYVAQGGPDVPRLVV